MINKKDIFMLFVAVPLIVGETGCLLITGHLLSAMQALMVIGSFWTMAGAFL